MAGRISEMPTARSGYSVIVFDWDGTLMDSTVGITIAIQEAARDVGMPVPSPEVASHVIGLGLQDLLRGAVPLLPSERSHEFVAAFRNHFQAQEEAMGLFPGIPELLDELCLRNLRLAIATGKSRRGLEHALRATGLEGYFSATRCAEETNEKPHPAMLLELMDELAVDRHGMLMIGDTSHDLDMAQRAGVDGLAVGYGAHPLETLSAMHTRACVGSVNELRLWLSKNA
jgi:phosphoglycolate phosphatase